MDYILTHKSLLADLCDHVSAILEKYNDIIYIGTFANIFSIIIPLQVHSDKTLRLVCI
ncbi:hypothetical protein SDC9_201283 [bioreactor metagenome]|uniref:Uncharacterized protein n=1 Tax=bioreactor metagenome TaxID=1076179 RepID=A0A645IT82_9ZZZZ